MWYIGYLQDVDTYELLPGEGEAIWEINESGYLAIVVMNQPVIARGEGTVSELREIHDKRETLMEQEGAYADAFYYCPSPIRDMRVRYQN